MYYVDVKHDGLKKFRRLSGTDKYVVEQRARAQREAWEEQWQRRYETDQKRSRQEKLLRELETKKAKAIRLTEEAQQQIQSLNLILANGLQQFKPFNWKSLYKSQPFSEKPPAPPPPIRVAQEPSVADVRFRPTVDLLSWIFPGVRRKKMEEALGRFDGAHAEWKIELQAADRQRESMYKSYQTNLAEWELRKTAFEENARTGHERIDRFCASYQGKDRDAVLEYLDLILSRSEYDDFFPKQWQMDLVSETGVLIVDYELPAPEHFPSLKAVKYVQSRDSLEQSFLRESEIWQIYDGAIYQTCLRTLYELFESDTANAITSITLNGSVNFVDKAN
ncbi:MAG TPA: hypothetical protein VHX61_15505 [Rhizomicrobium sp.]|jgi:restriction system protein|nr:hypothetical protein [Rhizomicrobium sp.]